MKSSPKRIVIFGINYAPELTGIAPYTTAVAEHYASEGHWVRVVTGVPHYPQWRGRAVPAGIGAGNPSVVRYRHFVPQQANALGRMAYEATWFISASRSLASQGVEVVIGIVPSLSGGLLALLGSRRWGAPVGIVVQDLMGPAALQSGYRGGVTVAGLTSRVERLMLRRADRVAIIAESFRPYLHRAHVSGSRIVRVRDWSRPSEPSESVLQCRRRLGWQDDEFVCLHAGNMGQKQGLDTVIDAALHLPSKGFRVVLAGDGNDRKRLRDRAASLGAANVQFIDLQPAGRYESMLRAADALIVNQRPSVGDMSFPSKLASYMAAGRPIIAAVASESETALEVRAAQSGQVVPAGDPIALAEAVNALKNAPEESGVFGRNGRDYASMRLTADAALREYDDFLAQLTGGSRSLARVSG